jgi:pyruvate, orthophosphate dikinase
VPHVIYSFGGGQADGSAVDVELLGAKGVCLHEMSAHGFPVPPGFTITTKACRHFLDNARKMPSGLMESLYEALAKVELLTESRLGGAARPLLLSVRSGARASMPGMMDTVLNVGLNDETVDALARDAGDERFAYDCYRRFIQMYGDVVMGLDHEVFEEILEDERAGRGCEFDTDLTADDWKEIILRYKAVIDEELGLPFPQDPQEQLVATIGAVFTCWTNSRAMTYRRMHNIPEDWGTAVTVQSMVFGNLGENSATGVAFTRNPATGEKSIVGEFLVNAQGQEVVSGTRTTQHVAEAARIAAGSDKPSLEKLMPEVFTQLRAVCDRLEQHYLDAQDTEFTVERGQLWMLQTRPAKRSARAAMKIAVDMADEGLISIRDAVVRIDPASLDQLLHPTIDPHTERQQIGSGMPASPGAASGEIVFSSDEAERRRAEGRKVILVRIETSPEDVHGMHAADGVLTTRGGMTSHAAVVARGMGKPCVTGAGTIRIDYVKGVMVAQGQEFRRGDIITIDGGLGQILKGVVPLMQPEFTGDFGRIMHWADGIRRMKVRSNADTPTDARTARAFGAEGIGLCRTEHMFFGAERIIAMREMIVAANEGERRNALSKLLPMQRADFVELFEIMAGLPVTIRLLDPPLHEFLPKEPAEFAEVAQSMGMPVEKMRERMNSLYEFNPMLGHRGCRLAVSYPEIPEMQTRAIFEAAIEAGRKTGKHVVPEIMVPLVSLMKELDFVKARIDAVAREVMDENGVTIDYIVGTMIELPRACVRAGVIAQAAEFFSFGTNDLTQTTFGISRDDASAFLPTYQQKSIIDHDPFITLDRVGVGELIKMAVDRGRASRPDIKLGICGEHGGEPDSIAFFEETGLDYVSCSPFRVPVARLAAAQATIISGVTSSMPAATS